MFENQIQRLFDKLPPLAKLRALTMGDHIRIRGTVKIWNGDRYIVAQNRIVTQGIKLILQFLSSVAYGGITAYMASTLYVTGSSNSRMRIGSDTTTATTEGMTALSSENTTDRNSASVTLSKVAAGHYRVAWVASWNAGTVSGTLGEIGLYLSGIAPIVDGSLPSLNPSVFNTASAPYLFSRLSSASGDFVSFTINVAVPLTIEWDLDITF